MLQQTVVWAVVCLAALGLCLWRPDLGRVVLGVFFIVMAVGVNIVFVLAAPDGFVKLGTNAPLIPFYEWVFENVVVEAPALVGLLVAAFEITIGVLMVKESRWTKWGLIAGMAFLVAISPLGPWTLPNLIMAAALGVVLWRRRERPEAGLPTRAGQASA